MKYFIKRLLQKHNIPIRLAQEIRHEFHLMILRLNNRFNPYMKTKARNLYNLKEIKIHFGCGHRIIEGWVNIDAYQFKGVDYCMDLRTALPFSNNSAKFIFSEHVLEHLEYDVIPLIFKDFYRILKPGGIIRIIVPDLEQYCLNYVEGNTEWFEKIFPTFSRAEAVNSVFNDHFHRHIYDFDTLERCLKKAGFKNIIQTDYLKSKCSELSMDTDADSRRYGSLCVEALKERSFNEKL